MSRNGHRWIRCTAAALTALAVAFVLLLGTGFALAQRADEPAPGVRGAAPTPALPMLRVHVVANSDAPFDQAVKLEVWHRIAPRLARAVAGAGTAAEAEAHLRPELPALEADIAAFLERRGVAYGVKVELDTFEFGPRSFDQPGLSGLGLPAGAYRTLRVTLGQGEGRNWWCVLFPSLCFVDEAEGELIRRQLAGDGTPGGTTPAPERPAVEIGLAWENLRLLVARFLGLEAKAAPAVDDAAYQYGRGQGGP